MGEVLNFVSAVTGIATTVMVVVLWVRERASRRLVRIVVGDGAGATVELPFPVLSSTLSRAEVLGILGTYAGGRRFDMRNALDLIPQLDRVRRGLADRLFAVVDREAFEAVQTAVVGMAVRP